jgi:hypothetical protein
MPSARVAFRHGLRASAPAKAAPAPWQTAEHQKREAIRRRAKGEELLADVGPSYKMCRVERLRGFDRERITQTTDTGKTKTRIVV